MKKDSNIANKIEHLENNLIKRANFAHNFKNLFIYYLYWYIKNLKSIILTVLLCLIIIFGIIIPLERNFAFYKDVSNETLLKAATMISWTAEYFYHLIVIFLLYFFSKIKNSNLLRLASIAVLISLIFSTLVVRTSKVLFGRLRPIIVEQINTSDTFKPLNIQHKYHSFPSGHTSSSFSTTSSIIAVNPIVSVPFVIYSSVIGLSRISLRQHYPSDIIFGGIIGIISGLPFISLAKKIKPKF